LEKEIKEINTKIDYLIQLNNHAHSF